MKLVSILNEELVFTRVSGNSRKDIYTEILKQAQEAMEHKLNIAEVVDGMMEREETLCIPYDTAVALPHLRQESFDDLYIIIGILAKPVKLQSCDPVPCEIVVMSLISPDTSDLYLKTISCLLRFFATAANRQKLAQAASPAAVLNILDNAELAVRNHLVADDVVNRKVKTLRADNTLADAIDLFSSEDHPVLPVVDANGKLVGELAAIDILKHFIPEYIFMMDNLEFLTSFEPFNRIFREENQHLVQNYMRTPELVVSTETPLIQFTVKMAKNNIRTCFVVDGHGKFVGEIMVKHIVKKVLRG